MILIVTIYTQTTIVAIAGGPAGGISPYLVVYIVDVVTYSPPNISTSIIC